MGFNGSPRAIVDNPYQHHKIDAIGRHMQVKIKKAVKSDGNKAAQGTDGKEKSQRI